VKGPWVEKSLLHEVSDSFSRMITVLQNALKGLNQKSGAVTTMPGFEILQG
jgi:hypothetical protein